MKELCENCGVCCRIIPIDWENKILLRDGQQVFDENFEDNLVPISKNKALEIDYNYVKSIQKLFPNAEFFSCKYISDNNICTNPQKPDFCSGFPNSPFACTTENCPYTGEIFLKKEAIMQKIRRLKEEIVDYQAQILTTKNKQEKEHYKKIIVHHQKYIGKYKVFGSKNW